VQRPPAASLSVRNARLAAAPAGCRTGPKLAAPSAAAAAQAAQALAAPVPVLPGAQPATATAAIAAPGSAASVQPAMATAAIAVPGFVASAQPAMATAAIVASGSAASAQPAMAAAAIVAPESVASVQPATAIVASGSAASAQPAAWSAVPAASCAVAAPPSSAAGNCPDPCRRFSRSNRGAWRRRPLRPCAAAQEQDQPRHPTRVSISWNLPFPRVNPSLAFHELDQASAETVRGLLDVHHVLARRFGRGGSTYLFAEFHCHNRPRWEGPPLSVNELH